MLLRTASVATLMAFAAPASAAVIFDSLDSATNESSGTDPMAATFTTSAAAKGVDVSVLISGFGIGDALPGDTFTVSLNGGIPLADLTLRAVSSRPFAIADRNDRRRIWTGLELDHASHDQPEAFAHSGEL